MGTTRIDLYEAALNKSHEQGFRVGRRWLTERGAGRVEAYQVLNALDLAGVQARYPSNDPLLSDEARHYLPRADYEDILRRKSTRRNNLVHDDGEQEDEAGELLATLRGVVHQHSTDGKIDLSPLATTELVNSTETLAKFASEANVILGAMLVELQARFDRDPQLLHDLGHPNFKSFIQERVAIGYETSIKLMQIVRVYHQQGGIELQTLLDTPYTKLYAGVSLAKREPQQALANAQTKTLREIEKADPFVASDLEKVAPDPLVPLDTQRYPQTLVEVFDAARDRVAAIGRNAGIDVNTHNTLEVLCNLALSIPSEVLAEEWRGLSKD